MSTFNKSREVQRGRERERCIRAVRSSRSMHLHVCAHTCKHSRISGRFVTRNNVLGRLAREAALPVFVFANTLSGHKHRRCIHMCVRVHCARCNVRGRERERERRDNYGMADLCTLPTTSILERHFKSIVIRDTLVPIRGEKEYWFKMILIYQCSRREAKIIFHHFQFPRSIIYDR